MNPFEKMSKEETEKKIVANGYTRKEAKKIIQDAERSWQNGISVPLDFYTDHKFPVKSYYDISNGKKPKNPRPDDEFFIR